MSQARFKQSRKEWANSADVLAEHCYCDYFGVRKSNIYDLESLVDEVHDRKNGYKTHQILDYGGVDRIVDCGDRHIYIAQRYRPVGSRDKDVSLRTQTGEPGRCAELVKWKTAYQTRGFIPSVYAFGLYEDVLEVFKKFYLFDLKKIVSHLLSGDIRGEEHEKEDGTAALYIPIDNLKNTNVLVNEWDGVTPDTGVLD